MSNIAVLNKILDIRIEEKNSALIDQKKATDQFEKVAKELYINLKAKEDAEHTLKKIVQSEVIQTIRDQSLYIDSLKEKINSLQQQVQTARQQMEEKQFIVTEKHIEVKKIEKIIESRNQKMIEKEKDSEMKFMDEISLNQFIRAK